MVLRAKLVSTMASRKYPLDPLVRLREQQVDDKTRGLSTAVTAREAAELERSQAELARRQAEQRAERLRDAERAALARGELRVGDLQRSQAWEIGVAAEQRRLAQQESGAAEKEKTARAKEDEARAELAASKADAEVVGKDKQRFVDRERRAQDARDEEAVAEAWRPKRG